MHVASTRYKSNEVNKMFVFNQIVKIIIIMKTIESNAFDEQGAVRKWEGTNK